MVDYVRCVRVSYGWVPVTGRRIVGRVVASFFKINGEKAVKEAAVLCSQNPHVLYNFDFTNSYRPTHKRIMDLLHRVPNVRMLACSGYVLRERVCRVWKEFFQPLLLPVGGSKKWTESVFAFVRERLYVGDNMGSICRQLNMFDIKISVKGLLKWRWREIKGPPPVFVW